MRAPERLMGQRVVAEPAAIDALVASLPARVTVLRFAPDEAFIVGASATRSTTRTRSSRTRSASSRSRSTARSSRGTSNGRCRRPARSPRAPSPACRPSSPGSRTVGHGSSPTPPTPPSSRIACDERLHRAPCSPIRWADEPKPRLRRRDHRRRRPRPVDRLPPGDPPRDHRTSRSSRPTTSPAATPAGTRRSSGPTTASPRRSASTSTHWSATRSSRRRPAPRSSTRPRASCGWPTRRWRCAPSAPARR